MTLRRELWALGRRYRLHLRIPGSPDIAFPGARLAVFVDGCFWHGCPEHYTAPVANSDFWRAKLERNLARDRRVDQQLREQGWRVLRVWEHEIETSPSAAVNRVLHALGDHRLENTPNLAEAPTPVSRLGADSRHS